MDTYQRLQTETAYVTWLVGLGGSHGHSGWEKVAWLKTSTIETTSIVQQEAAQSSTVRGAAFAQLIKVGETCLKCQDFPLKKVS